MRRLALPLLWLFCASLAACGGEGDSEAAVDLLPGEIGEETPLLRDDGTVAAHGWARGPLMQYDRSQIDPALAGSLREWEYYDIYTPEFSMGLTFTDLGSNTICIPTLEDYNSGIAHYAVILSNSAALDFPPTPFGDTHLEASGSTVDYRYAEGKRTVDVVSPQYEAHLELVDSPEAESVAVVHTFDEPGYFFYENKRLPMPAKGTVKVAGLTFEFAEGEAFGALDWGRGVWPSKVHWEWAHFQGVVGGREVGVNLGQVMEGHTNGTADAVLVDGVMHPVGRVPWSYDTTQTMEPWRFVSEEAGVDLKLTPVFDDPAVLPLGTLYSMTRSKAHGPLSGTVRLADGSTLEIDGLYGSAEVVEITW